MPLLHELAVDERAQREVVEVELGCRHETRPDRREAVVALGEHVRAGVGPPQVVHAEVVGRGDPADARRRLRDGDAPRWTTDDERDLSLVAEELAALRAHDRSAVDGSDDAGLKKYDGEVGMRPRSSARLR